MRKKSFFSNATLNELGRCLLYNRKNTCTVDAKVLCAIAAIKKRKITLEITDGGLYPGTPGSRAEPKADAQLLSHPGIP